MNETKTRVATRAHLSRLSKHGTAARKQSATQSSESNNNNFLLLLFRLPEVGLEAEAAFSNLTFCPTWPDFFGGGKKVERAVSLNWPVSTAG